MSGSVTDGSQTNIVVPGRRTLASDLAGLRGGCFAFEVAHKRDMEHYEKWKRRLGIAVVVLTAATSTAVLTALATNTNAAAKVIVGVLSVASAVAAALNERGPFTEQEKLHQERAAEFNQIHRKTVLLHRQWSRGKVDDDEVDRQLAKLESSYDDLEGKPPGVRDYQSAREWADAHERTDELLT